MSDTLPERCITDTKHCLSDARVGCTVAKMRSVLRTERVPGMWTMRKARLCEEIASRRMKRPAAPKSSRSKTVTKTPPKTKTIRPVTKTPKSGRLVTKTPKTPKNVPASLVPPKTGSPPKKSLRDRFVKFMTSPDKPREPLQKTNYIWKDARYLGGPFAVTVFQTPDDKQIYLLGDVHHGVDFMCPPKAANTVVIPDLLEEVFEKRTGKNTDLFLEIWPTSDLERPNADDILKRTVNAFKNEFLKPRDRKYPAVRCHYADVRDADLHDIPTLFSDYFVKSIDTLPKVRAFFEIFLTSDDFTNDLKKLLPTCCKGGQKQSKIRKQLSKLEKVSKSDADVILAHARDKLARTLAVISDKDYAVYVDVLLSDKNDGSVLDNLYKALYAELGTIIMDAYLMSRMMYYIRTAQTAGGLTVVYAGDYHREQYALMLRNIYGEPRLHVKWTVFSVVVTKRHKLRCLDLEASTQLKQTMPPGSYISSTLKVFRSLPEFKNYRKL